MSLMIVAAYRSRELAEKRMREMTKKRPYFEISVLESQPLYLVGARKGPYRRSGAGAAQARSSSGLAARYVY